MLVVFAPSCSVSLIVLPACSRRLFSTQVCVLTSIRGGTASYSADFFGRRIAVMIGLVVVFVGAIIQVVPAVNSGMYIGGRFLVGFG